MNYGKPDSFQSGMTYIDLFSNIWTRLITYYFINTGIIKRILQKLRKLYIFE